MRFLKKENKDLEGESKRDSHNVIIKKGGYHMQNNNSFMLNGEKVRKKKVYVVLKKLAISTSQDANDFSLKREASINTHMTPLIRTTKPYSKLQSDMY